MLSRLPTLCLTGLKAVLRLCRWCCSRMQPCPTSLQARAVSLSLSLSLSLSHTHTHTHARFARQQQQGLLNIASSNAASHLTEAVLCPCLHTSAVSEHTCPWLFVPHPSHNFVGHVQQLCGQGSTLLEAGYNCKCLQKHPQRTIHLHRTHDDLPKPSAPLCTTPCTCWLMEACCPLLLLLSVLPWLPVGACLCVYTCVCMCVHVSVDVCAYAHACAHAQ